MKLREGKSAHSCQNRKKQRRGGGEVGGAEIWLAPSAWRHPKLWSPRLGDSSGLTVREAGRGCGLGGEGAGAPEVPAPCHACPPKKREWGGTTASRSGCSLCSDPAAWEESEILQARTKMRRIKCVVLRKIDRIGQKIQRKPGFFIKKKKKSKPNKMLFFLANLVKILKQ